MDYRLTGLFVWRRVCALGYTPLESFLSVEPMLDEALICADYANDEEMRHLCGALADKFPKVRIVEFGWPMGSSGDGSVIGVASNYALAQARGNYCVNIQCDEIWPQPLMEWTHANWREGAKKGLECLDYKVLNTEHNAQFYQGDDPDFWFDGQEHEPSTWEWQNGAGYNRSVKLFKHCPAITFQHDGWSMQGCATLAHVDESERYPIVHLHDFHRDSLIALRRTAADGIWTNQVAFGHYRQTADNIEQSQHGWWDLDTWTRTTSPFGDLLPDFAKRLLGRVHYQVDWDLLENWQ